MKFLLIASALLSACSVLTPDPCVKCVRDHRDVAMHAPPKDIWIKIWEKESDDD